MKIEFVDLKRQLFNNDNKEIKGIIGEILDEVSQCAHETAFTMGSRLEKFEKVFAEYCEAPYCIGLNSGTDALEFALRCNNITGGNVITVPNSYFTTASSISQVGAIPIFVDIDPRHWNLDPSQLEQKIDEETRAILVVHLYGKPAPMDRVMEIANKFNIEVIEDCCHAHGARFQNKKVPFSKTGVFSFFPGKNLGCWGDGGALITDDGEAANLAMLLRNDGSRIKYRHEILGRKARLHSLQAAILTVKLKYLDSWNAMRRRHASSYNELLNNIEEIQLPMHNEVQEDSVYHIYAILTKKRDQLQNYLEKKGISTRIHYPIPIHLQPAYQHLQLKAGTFPVAEDFAKKTLSLPMFPELHDGEIEYICRSIKDFFHTR